MCQGSAVGESALGVEAMDAEEVDRLSPLAGLLDDEQEERTAGKAVLRGAGSGGGSEGGRHRAKEGSKDLEALEALAGAPRRR